jgi:hypothetical protein
MNREEQLRISYRPFLRALSEGIQNAVLAQGISAGDTFELSYKAKLTDDDFDADGKLRLEEVEPYIGLSVTLMMSSFDALQAGVAIVDPSTPLRAAKQAKRLKPEDVVMLSTMTDPYAPEAQAHGLGRTCAAAVLENSQASLRVLTKNSGWRTTLNTSPNLKAATCWG